MDENKKAHNAIMRPCTNLLDVTNAPLNIFYFLLNAVVLELEHLPFLGFLPLDIKIVGVKEVVNICAHRPNITLIIHIQIQEC